MARQDILLIGLEYNSLRILEVSLRKAGFMVASVMNYSDAIEQIKIAVPDLVIIDSIKDAESFEFASSLKGEYKGIPVILISSNKEINTRIRALEIGIDDYLVKPVYIKEIVARIKIHLHRREQMRVEEGITAGFIGSLSDIGLYDIIQTIELNKKSGILEIKGRLQDGRIYFKNGQMIQASVGKLRGELAVYRMLTFGEGVFKMSFLDIDVELEIKRPNNALIMDGMRRLDEYMKYTEQLPVLTTRLEVDSDILAERLKEIPDNVNKVLRLINSERSINDIIEMSELDELETLKIISALYFDGIVYDIFSKKVSEEKKTTSTLPEPGVGFVVKSDTVPVTEAGKPQTSEIWAEKIFDKESTDSNEKKSDTDTGKADIANSSKLSELKTEIKTEVVANDDQKNSEKVDDKGRVKSSEIPSLNAAIPVTQTAEIISDEKSQKSPEEQIIENKLIENVTLSTSSYVKGSLLRKQGSKIKVEEKRGGSLIALVVVFIVVVAGLYLGYRYYYLPGVATKDGKREEIVRVEPVKEIKKESPVKLEEKESEKEAKIDEVQIKEEKEKIASLNQNQNNSGTDLTKERRDSGAVQNDEKENQSRQEVKNQEEIVIDMDGYKTLLKSAQNLYKAGNLVGAKEELKQSLIKNPRGFEAFTLLGQIDLEKNKVKSALTYLRRAVSYDRKYAPAYFYLGTCYQLNGNNLLAKKMYQKYLSLSPNGEFANDVRAIILDLK